MSSDERYKAINIEAISKEQLSKFRLYMKQHDKTYVLYKDADIPFTLKDTERLMRNNVNNLYVLYGDFEGYNTCVESNLREIALNPDSKAKTTMIVQASASYVDEVFNTSPKEIPHKLNRARLLIKSIMNLSLKDPKNLELITSIIGKSTSLYSHAVNVASISLALADYVYSLHTDELVDLGLAALLHDIGKIYLSDGLLEKPLTVLTEREKNEYYSHPEMGYTLLKGVESLPESVLDVIYNHHEREDGKGFPRKLNGATLTRSVKVVAISNAYCELIAPKVYREALSAEDAIAVIEKDMALWFSPKLLTKLKELVL